MNIGIVTTWFERGASYVSRQFENVLATENRVFIYARGGEQYAIGDPKWDRENVTWGLRRMAPFSGTLIARNDFITWCKAKQLDIVLFNEQEWWYPVLWCNELKIPSVCYVDYYKKNTIPLFSAYTALICNTKRHYSVFNWHKNSYYVPWGTDCSLFRPLNLDFHLVNDRYVTFFHSSGLDPYRKGTDLVLLAAEEINEPFKLIIHTQLDLSAHFDHKIQIIIDKLLNEGKLEIISKTVPAPGLFHLGDVYVYPSRLEGIGLTIAEAQACGLIPVVTNNGPMNEFINNDSGFLIDVSNYFARPDGYYWPECSPDFQSLRNTMIKLIRSKEQIATMKEANYKYANENLNWIKNSKDILQIFSSIKFSPVEESTKRKIIEFEENGFRKLNRIYLKYFWVMNLMHKAFKKLSPAI
jgi:1,2-diacylglycerol 3-alpha-glucosyltransferase